MPATVTTERTEAIRGSPRRCSHETAGPSMNVSNVATASGINTGRAQYKQATARTTVTNIAKVGAIRCHAIAGLRGVVIESVPKKGGRGSAEPQPMCTEAQ